MNIKPIKTEQDYGLALEEISRLMDLKNPTEAQYDKLDVLATLVEAYEDTHYPIDLPDPIEAILYFMESRGITRKDLKEPLYGHVSEVLNRKKGLSLNMIRNLHNHFKIPTDLLIKDTLNTP